MTFIPSYILTFFNSTLELVDKALQSAAEAGRKTSKRADKNFGKAIETLSDYEMNCHTTPLMPDGGNGNIVHKRMEVAKQKDKSSSSILNRLKESFRVREELASLLSPHSHTEF
jgi:hypothetical protein